MRLSNMINGFEQRVRHVQLNVRDAKLIRHLKLPALTNSEMVEIKKAWPCFKFRKLDLAWSRVYKMKKGFSPWFLNDAQYVELLRRTNPKNQVEALQNKAMCDVYFPDITFPRVFVRCLNGIYYDTTMKQLSLEEVCSILLQQSCFMIKPSIDSMCGKGVKRIVTEGKTHEDIMIMVKEAGSNFITQEVIRQHPDIQKLNETSLNCCRVTTLLLNGKFDYSAIIKFGKKNSNIDNWNSGYLTGITKDGIIKDVAYDVDLNEISITDNGTRFGGLKYPCFDEMICQLELWHKKYFANCGVVGWDVIINECNKVNVIEANLAFPGIQAEQLCGDLFFEPFQDEILKIMSHEEH